MKSEKGVSLVSLIIYIIAMLITVTIITVVTSYFYKNIDVTNEKYTYHSQFTNFESYFAEEANRPHNRVLKIVNIEEPITENSQGYIALSSGNQYTYIPGNKAIYKNNIKIASGVENCIFETGKKNGNDVASISITIQDKTKKIDYILQK